MMSQSPRSDGSFLSPTGSRGSRSSRRSVYDSPQARHKALRDTLDRTCLLQENATVGSLNMLEEAMGEVDDIHDDIDDKIVYQDQILLDSQVMKISSSVIRGAMQSLTQETNPYSAAEFADNLLTYVCNLSDETVVEPNWELLGREVTPLIKVCGYSQDLLHCMEPIPKAEIQPKAPRVVANRKRDALMPAKKPEKVVAIDNDDNPVDKSVDKIAHMIKKYCKRNKQPLNFFKLIVNPNDFGKTVENMLHVAFLVRDGRMALVVGDDDDLLIEPVPTEIQAARQEAGNVARIANILGLTMETWKLLIDELEITEPMINFD